VRTIERWISGGGLAARQASQEQLGWLVGHGRLRGIPPHGQVWLIGQEDLDGYQPRRAGRRRREEGGS
jgi:hypothetical protein